MIILCMDKTFYDPYHQLSYFQVLALMDLQISVVFLHTYFYSYHFLDLPPFISYHMIDCIVLLCRVWELI